MLFGETAELLQQTDKWLKIRSLEDQYEGFVDSKQYILLSELDLEHWKTSRKRYFMPASMKSPRGLIQLPAGCFLKESFSISNQHYSIDSIMPSFSTWKQFAMSFLNTPYLWGGRSHYGIDCSGFSQQVMRFQKIELPRDASQQVLLGTEIAFHDRKEGDVAFFQNSTEKVTHVGILLEHNKIIHASGFVKIDNFTEKGIICLENNTMTHQFHSIKRYISIQI
jgi:cell wall-associated NlpC family hydrolase